MLRHIVCCSGSDTEDAEFTDFAEYVLADAVKPELSADTASTERRAQQSDLGTRVKRRSKQPTTTKRGRRCRICGQRYVRMKRLETHMKTVHGENGETNGATSYALRTRVSRKSDEAERTHACFICSRRFRNSRDLSLHMRIHSGVKPHVCDDCGKQFTTVSQLRSHYRTHTQEQAYKCGDCGERFVWLNSLKRHRKVHEEAAADGSESLDGPGELSIDGAEQDEEGRPLSRPGGRPLPKKAGGLRTRWSNGRSPCAVCGKPVVDMRKHLLTHSGEKRHQCILCGRSFGMASTLTVHMRSHTGEKPFGCEECGKHFTTRSHLTVHTRKHTREEPYECRLCGEKFVWLNSMKRHMQLHEEMENQLYGGVGDGVPAQLMDGTTVIDANGIPHVGENSLTSADFPTEKMQAVSSTHKNMLTL